MNGDHDIISGLCRSALNVAFCDESETSGKPREGLAPDLRLLCALVMPSETYVECKKRLERRLFSLCRDLKEFHSTDIVNPSRASSWHNISFKDRVNAFRFLAKLMVEFTQRLFYCFISREQYGEMRRRATTPIHMNYGPALRKVFLVTLIERMTTTDRTPAIVLDQQKRLDCAKVAPWAWARSPLLYKEGVILSPSHIVPGLQLADHAAYTITRYRLKRDTLLHDTVNPFDRQVAYSLAKLMGRVEDLLRTD